MKITEITDKSRLDEFGPLLNVPLGVQVLASRLAPYVPGALAVAHGALKFGHPALGTAGVTANTVGNTIDSIDTATDTAASYFDDEGRQAVAKATDDDIPQLDHELDIPSE